ncbi:hypothetical protein TWF106_000859 [Orbilia oligospora]|uniref:Uncharacterized protein n=1 Tax=Orbilia oligospora TaxID=2813651 RepID=A0A6G1LY33_ORBOL|nr:hypothetical protein TWF788_009756 [Orbilia oligospora]KAF3201900.1 hypothetical protein TWF679_011187 [Orbilia oligospora]KAF3226366.1 hypothetical protein TWF106_000859 [Orbilia oligospora]KAF3228924.1 hypothetical protein TWF191_002037 [Orbilia oligospora]KAF3235937.1 hypothetical protein TWF192_000592 [Orbilia oligospora]
MKISAYIIVVPFLIPVVLSAPLASNDFGIYKRFPQLAMAYRSGKILQRAPNSDVADVPESGVMKKLFFEAPVIERLDPQIRKAIEDMPDSVFDKLSTLAGDRFLAYLDDLLAGKIPS